MFFFYFLFHAFFSLPWYFATFILINLSCTSKLSLYWPWLSHKQDPRDLKEETIFVSSIFFLPVNISKIICIYFRFILTNQRSVIIIIEKQFWRMISSQCNSLRIPSRINLRNRCMSESEPLSNGENLLNSNGTFNTTTIFTNFSEKYFSSHFFSLWRT